ncbi:serine/threonine-protein kinase PAK 2-like [Agelaius tricolor]|uniref:serine/threonine-protein kinase PAK 2-like n=1 Tax=Agelaius tricolor TaxID=9191 RepID=UPI0039F17429
MDAEEALEFKFVWENPEAGILCHVKLLIARGERPQLRQPNRFSPCLRDFLSCCLQTDEEQRWSAKELLQHPFVTSAKPASTLVPLINSVMKKKKKETRM